MKSLITILLLTSSSAFANDCMIPFQTMVSTVTGQHFTAADVYNDFANVKDMYRQRFLVINLDSMENGSCKGVSEHYPSKGEMPTHLFPELANPADALSYQNSVLKYHKDPLQKEPIVRGNCIGQTVSMCELRGNQVVEVAKLATSGRSGDYGVPPVGYYAQLNYINTRSWDIYSRAAYNPNIDGPRDMEMGGVDEYKMSGPRTVWFSTDPEKPKYAMPNFMNFVHAPGYPGVNENGLHEISGGETLGSNLGAPVSHGCLRLTRYGAILMRWWVPRGARAFIHFNEDNYRKYANPNMNR